MLIYILKFSACLFIFLLFYKLVLENERMHTFKRYYLLAALLVAINIPLVTFTEYVEPVVSAITFTETTQFSFEPEAIVEPTLLDYLPQILWSIYGLGVLVFGLKFIWNLTHIVKKIKQNPKLKSNHFITVLLSDAITPHTFFNYIFFNKYKYETQQIPKEVLIHEQTHAKQKHSIDILIIELLQVALWFNPLIYFTKHAIKLNHEFLADQAVLGNGIQPSQYQQLLLAFSSNAVEPQLANAINYSSIKKRFTVMKTHTSKQKIWFRSLLLLPLAALTLYGFSEKEIIEKETPAIVSLSDSIDLFLNEKGELLLNEKIITLMEIEELFKLNNKIHISVKAFPNVDSKIVDKIALKIRNIGVKKMTFCTSGDTVQSAPDKVRMEMMKSLIESQNQQKATPEEVEEYNKLAKQYNAQPKEKRVVKLKDLNRLETIYKKMTKEQKAAAESFPDCPPPPSAPEAPKPPKVIEGKELPPPPAPDAPKKKTVVKGKDWEDVEKILKTNTLSEVDDVPPPPPPPKSPLDHIIDMSKRGAIFYYEGKSISSDEAISLLKKNNNLNIQTKQVDSKEPKVYITKEPIVIDKKNLPKPTANNAINHLKVMNRHDAIFYLNNNEVTFEEALKAVRKNKNSDISSTMTPPVVKITDRLTGVLGKS